MRARLALCLLLAGWAQTVAGQTQPQTEVFVLGMIHGAHRTSERWGLDQVRATIEALDPDVVCPEIPPANWAATLTTWREKHVVEVSSRVRVFPEYVDVLLPLTDEMDFVVEPCAGWTAEMARARRERLAEFEKSAADSAARAAYDRDEQWVQSWLTAHEAPAPDDDPFYIHSPAYDLRTKAELGPYEYHLNDVIGPPGGWRYINDEHFKLIAAAIAKHPGKRILITFGAGHKYWFLERLRDMPAVVVRDVRPYLPGSADRAISVQQAAAEDLLAGIEDLRVWWTENRGDSGLAWHRFESRLAPQDDPAGLARLRATRNRWHNEFRDGFYLGPVQVVSHQDGVLRLRAEVSHLRDRTADRAWLTATLVADPSRPGGFAWQALDVPGL